jgi:hypothetical protein
MWVTIRAPAAGSMSFFHPFVPTSLRPYVPCFFNASASANGSAETTAEA